MSRAPARRPRVVVTGAGSWRLHLPEQVSSTRDAEGGPPGLAALQQARLASEEAKRRHATLSPQEARAALAPLAFAVGDGAVWATSTTMMW